MTPGLSALWGVKVAMVPVAGSSTTEAAVTGAKPGPGPVTVKVTLLMVVGSICRPDGTLKDALTFVLGHTLIAFAAGASATTETGFGGPIVAAVVNAHT